MVTHHLVFITHHLLLSFHHLSLKTPHPVWHHHSLVITQYFSIICCPIPVPCVAFTLFFFLQPPVLTEPNEKKIIVKIKTKLTEPKKKKKGRTEDRTVKKKNSKVKSCGCGSLHICLIIKMSLSYELWKLKTVKMCFQFP